MLHYDLRCTSTYLPFVFHFERVQPFVRTALVYYDTFLYICERLYLYYNIIPSYVQVRHYNIIIGGEDFIILTTENAVGRRSRVNRRFYTSRRTHGNEAE
jgi:hypothetical protein